MKNVKLEKIKTFIRESKIDAILLDSWQNVFYASAFTGFEDALLIVTANSQYIVTDSRYTAQSKEQCPDFTLVTAYKHNVAEVKKVLKAEKIKAIGFEEKAITLAEYEDFYKRLHVKLKPVSALFDIVRYHKTEDEIETIEKACDIAAQALERTIPFIKPGVKESEVAAKLEFEMRMGGADRPSFATVVASGVRGSMPHGTATEKVIEEGDAVTIDFGAFYKGYCSDCTRTFFVGKIGNPELEKIYNVVLKAQRAALDSYYEGMPASELDAVARNIITEAGFGKEFGHATGHGVGIDIHEGVRVSTHSDEILEKGIVFSVEPGIYLEGLGGVRIEDLVTPENGKLKIMTKGPATDLTVL